MLYVVKLVRRVDEQGIEAVLGTLQVREPPCLASPGAQPQARHAHTVALPLRCPDDAWLWCV
jgi:hypothetical protein